MGSSVRKPSRSRVLIGVALLLGALASRAWAHGFAGKRFFPTTFEIEDPFVSDELSVLSSATREPGEDDEPRVRSWRTSIELSKRITPNLGISVEGEILRRKPVGQRAKRGFGNLGVGAKYQFLMSETHETVASVGLEAEVGSTGDPDVEAESFSTLSPGFFFGKGFGDLPTRFGLLRPLAITGLVSARIPTEASSRVSVVDPGSGSVGRETRRNPLSLSSGLTLQYNPAYLNAFVRQTPIPGPLNRVIPVIELQLETCLDRGCGGQTTGTLNPGLIWSGRKLEIGLAAKIPINDRTGEDLGALLLVHLFVDDLFPRSVGRPMVGN